MQVKLKYLGTRRGAGPIVHVRQKGQRPARAAPRRHEAAGVAARAGDESSQKLGGIQEGGGHGGAAMECGGPLRRGNGEEEEESMRALRLQGQQGKWAGRGARRRVWGAARAPRHGRPQKIAPPMRVCEGAGIGVLGMRGGRKQGWCMTQTGGVLG